MKRSRSVVLLALLCAQTVGCVSQDETVTSSAEGLTLITNYALGKPTTQSTTAFGGDSSRAVDGNTSGVWANNSVTHTDLQSHSWWQVDLLQARFIDTINVFGRTDPCCTSRLANYWVLASPSPFASTDLSTTLADPKVTKRYVLGGSQLPAQSITVGVVARYVRVQLSGEDYLSLAEVQVLDQPNVIPGPDQIAGKTSWTPTGVVTSSNAFALAEVGDSLRSYQRGADGLLQESIDFGTPHDVAGSPQITSDGVSAVTDPASGGHTFVVARAADGDVVVVDLDPVTGSSTWRELWATDGPPSVAVACGKVYVAIRNRQALNVFTRPLGTLDWSVPNYYQFARTPPMLAAGAGGDIGLAWIGTDNWIRFARGTCATGGTLGGAVTPGGTSFSSTRVGLASYGNLFGLAVQGTDNLPYFALQRRDASGNPVWAGFESIDSAVAMIESPTVVIYRGLIFMAGRDSLNQLRYWVRDPNFLARISGQVGWTGGRIVSGWGTGATPPALSLRGTRQLCDNYGYCETVPAELYVATKGIGDQQIYALNFGRFATWDILNGMFGIQFNTHFEGNDIDPRLTGNFPDFLPGFLQAPSGYWWSLSHPTQCNGTLPLTILLSTNWATGWTKAGCGTFYGDDGRSFAMPASLQNANQYGPWTLWEELGHQLQAAVPNFKNQPGWQVNFTNLKPKTCNTAAECGGGFCALGCIAGTDGSATCPWGSEPYTTQRVCQNAGFGQALVRPAGFVDWYDVTMDEHSFLDFVEWYRWWGDELRAMRDQDLAQGNTMLRDKYAWVKAFYYGGVEFGGSHANMANGGSRASGAYGMPLQ
jgi:hypothetical protein